MEAKVTYQSMPCRVKAIVYQNEDLSYMIVLNKKFNLEELEKELVKEIENIENCNIAGGKLCVLHRTLVTG